MMLLSYGKQCLQNTKNYLMCAITYRLCARNLGVRIFIARLHAMHAERDIALPILPVRLSVRLSVLPMPVMGQNEWTYRHTYLTYLTLW